jgi:site-specific DNA-methyltransferase (adenine-specific)
MNTDLMFSSATDQWATPRAFFDQWNALFSFDLDVCADASNAKCPRFFDLEADGLVQDWAPETCWMNPPYGREIGRWVKKAYEDSLKGATVVCLLPARTDTAWWHDYVIPHAKVHFVRGRLKFGNATSGAPFPSAVAVFYPPKVAG